MKPTIGRIVWVRRVSPNDTAICPAIVCEVHGDTCISVQVFARDGGEFLSSVTQSEGLTGTRCWDWMPYQKEQHAKTSE